MAIKRTIKRNTSDPIITIHMALEEFLAEKRGKNLAPISIHDYDQSVHFFMNFNQFNESTPLSVIENSLFTEWKLNLLEQELKPNSINRYLRDCKVFFTWCITKGYLKLPSLEIGMIKGQEPTIKAFSYDELLIITAKPTNVNNFPEWRLWTIIHWILGTGTRCSTVSNVRLGDIDFHNKEIVLAHTKNKKAQVLPLSSTLENILKDYIRTWRYDCTPEDFLFPNTANEQLTPEALAHAFAKYCKRRGCSRTNIHGLRHTFALNWIRNGGNQFKLQRILGHSTLEMTNRYVALVTADLKEDYDTFNPLDRMHQVRTKKPKMLICKENRNGI